MSDSDGDATIPSATTLEGTDPRWAWVAVVFGVWLVGGLALITRALNRGDATDVGMSPYHVVAYSGLLVLAAVSIYLVLRARRRGLGWRRAFPPGLGSLGAGLVALVATVVLDVAWREGVGINGGIENSIAPSRVLLDVGLALVAMAALRASLLAGGDRRIRWPATISAGLLAVVLSGFGGYSPVANRWVEKAPDSVADNAEVWLMDADGGRQTRLLEAVEGADLGAPVWSPDSQRIAYTRTESPGDLSTGDVDIWVANVDGTGARPFATGPTWQWFPRWSPDGAWLAYTDEAVGGPWLSSGPVGPAVGQGPQGAVLPGANAAAMPEADLWKRPVDGSGPPQRITDVAGDDRSGSWSPDGRRLAFDSTRDGNTEIYVVDADGSNSVRLTTSPAKDWAAAWSPDGTEIAFTSDRTGLAQIWVMRADGGDQVQLTDDTTDHLWPTWSPDGSRIAFARWWRGQTQVWSMAADGSDVRELSRSPSTNDFVWDGSWGPDGRIAFTRAGPPPPEALTIAREDFGVAAILISALALALVIGLLVRSGPPFGAVAVAMGIAAAFAASQFDSWQFVPAVVAAGLLVDVALRLAPGNRRLTIGSTGAAVGLVGAVAITVMATSSIGWSPTLLVGVMLATAIAGWGIGALLERHAPSSADTSTPLPQDGP